MRSFFLFCGFVCLNLSALSQDKPGAARVNWDDQIIQIKKNGDTVKMVLPGNIVEIIFYDTVQSLPCEYKFQQDILRSTS